MAENSQRDRSKTWGGALKENVVWFLFAILLAGGSSYINAEIARVSIKKDVASLQRRMQNIENNLGVNEKNTVEIRNEMVRLQTKINSLLSSQGIDPDRFDSIEPQIRQYQNRDVESDGN